MKWLTEGLVRAHKPFSMIAPGPVQILRPPFSKIVLSGLAVIGATRKILKGETFSDVLGESLGNLALRPVTRRLSIATYKSLMMAQIKSNRTLLEPAIAASEKNRDGRVVRKMRVMYHDANKAGKHLDVHIGRTSLIYRVSGKPVEGKIRFNNKGELTQESKEALLEHLRGEIANNSRVAQNLDHTIANAKCNWLVGEAGLSGYGSGLTRQLVVEDNVEFYHHRVRSSEHIYAPSIFGNQGTYLYQIYPGTETGTPILIWGKLIPRDLNFKDRLHLKLIQPEELDKFKDKIDILTNTRKYDGASTHFHSDTGQGFKFFSPRFSKETGHRVEYTYKVPEMAEVGHPSKPVGMGELLFWKRTLLGYALREFTEWRGPEWLCWHYMPASEIGGILNSHQVRPSDVWPEVRVYRIDKIEGENVFDFPFWQNRLLQISMTSGLDSHWKVVSLALPKRNWLSQRWEGFVGVPKDLSVNDGLKLKWWGDTQDWEITRNELSLSEKGNIQGVVWFRSLESGKEFKLGPGQIGSFDTCMSLVESADKCIGMVAKVHGRQGHEGRAAKLVDWHLDKGIL